MSNDTTPVVVKIMDNEYRIACPPEEREALQSAAAYLSNKMREIRETGKILGVERIAVMAALNISHELLKSNRENKGLGDFSNNRVQQLLDKIDMALSKSA